MKLISIDEVSKGTKDAILIFTGKNHSWIISEPDENNLRTVKNNGKEEGKGILLGSIISIPNGTTCSSDIKIGYKLGIKFPDCPKCQLIVTLPITDIMVEEKKAIK